jgi:hypothetical protein
MKSMKPALYLLGIITCQSLAVPPNPLPNPVPVAGFKPPMLFRQVTVSFRISGSMLLSGTRPAIV